MEDVLKVDVGNLLKVLGFFLSFFQAQVWVGVIRNEPIGTRETGDTSAKKERGHEGDLEAKDPCNEEEQLSEPIGVWDIGVTSATKESENVRESEAKGPCNDEEQLIEPSGGVMSATKESENTREVEAKSLGNEEKDQTVDNRAAIDRANTVHTQ